MIHIETQYDAQRGEVRCMASSTDGGEPYTVAKAVATEAEAASVAEQFKQMYRVRTASQEIPPVEVAP